MQNKEKNTNRKRNMAYILVALEKSAQVIVFANAGQSPSILKAF